MCSGVYMSTVKTQMDNCGPLFLVTSQHFIMILGSVGEAFWMLPLGNSGLLLMLRRKQASYSCSLEIRDAGNL